MNDQPPIEAGMNPDEAIAAMMKQCASRWFTQCNAESLIQWLFAQSGVPNIASFDEETRLAQLIQLRKHLSRPLTAHEAAALSGVGFGTYSVDQAIKRIRRQGRALNLNPLPPVDGRPEQGYWLDFRKAKDSEHWFGGECPVPAAPCINCEKPLLHFLSLDTHDPRVELAGFPHRHLPLLFCWTWG